MSGASNPFATVRAMVYGEAHVGRTAHIEALDQRVLTPSPPGATAIVGPPRIGKSSLAYHVFMRPEVRQAHPRLLPVWINVRLQPGGERLFRKMADSVWTMITEQDGELENQALRRRYDRVKDRSRDWYELQDDTQQFLKLVRALGWKVVLVLDEFDSARQVFKSLPGTFQALRELADNPDWSIGLVTTSRRELRDIVDIADPAESTFHGIFRELWLTCFDEAEMKDLAARAPMAITADESAQLAGRLLELTGGHPCLASLVLERLCATTGRAFSPERLEAAVAETRPEFRGYYQDLTDLLRSDGRFRALLEILLGPQITATIDDAERLLHEGLLIADGDRYRAFSDDFGRYLTMVGRETDYWPTWVSVEHGLRDLVEEVLTTAYPDGWADGVRRARPSLCEQLDLWVKLMEREQRSFGERASSRLLDFSYPKDLYVLMASYWDHFGKLLGHDKKYWNDRFELLSKVRNPMVHNRLLTVTSAERELFHAYCLEILELLAERAGA